MLRKWFILALMLFFIPGSAIAQQTIPFSSVVVDLWPEFDRPEMLVIYHITLSPSVSLPTNLVVQIPAHVGEPSAVAVRQADGALFSVQYQRMVRGQWADISLTATTPDIQIEYYDSTLTGNTSLRTYTFRWPVTVEVDSFTINVQQPVGATLMNINPSLGNGIVGSDGLTYYSGDVTSLLTDSIFELSLSYEKETDELSMMEVQIQPGTSLDDPSMVGQSEPVQTYLPWILGGLGIVFISGGAFWYWQSGRRQSSMPRRGERRRASNSSENPVIEETGQVYCHQCGKRAAEGDRFCRVCGTRLRIET
jgi:hypothetical protein